MDELLADVMEKSVVDRSSASMIRLAEKIRLVLTEDLLTVSELNDAARPWLVWGRIHMQPDQDTWLGACDVLERRHATAPVSD
jgi:hypothetical protein